MDIGTLETTFWWDFGIADKFGESAITDTYHRAITEWISNLEYATELVLVLNWKTWAWYDKGNEKLSALYSTLYYEAYDKLLDRYGENSGAMSYIFSKLD